MTIPNASQATASLAWLRSTIAHGETLRPSVTGIVMAIDLSELRKLEEVVRDHCEELASR